MQFFHRCISLCLAVLLADSASGQDTTLDLDQTVLAIRTIVQDRVIPYDLVWGPEGWIWFTERAGAIGRLDPQTGQVQLLHQEAEVYQSRDNSGMYALALHPNFARQPYVYVHYTFELYASRLVRYTYDAACGCLRDSVHLLPRILGHESHNGSRLLFGQDGMLYFTMGDAYVEDLAQDPYTLNGKVLRMTDAGGIPPDNPLPGSYAWTWGHRNPQGLIQLPSGAVFCSEHGDGRDDELNRLLPGRNYGWPLVAGLCDAAAEAAPCDQLAVVEPLRTWSPTSAPGGLAYYDHAAIPEWRHSLLQVFLKHLDGSLGQRMEVLRLTPGEDSIAAVKTYFAHTYGRLRAVLVAPDGRVFISTSNREMNGSQVVRPGDDRILELRNPDFPVLPAETPGLVQVYPNPAGDSWLVQVPVSTGRVQVRLCDLAGRELRRYDGWLAGPQVPMQREGLPAGSYLVAVQWSGGQAWCRLQVGV